MNQLQTFMCGLWHSHVITSPHNDNGACKCIKCGGTHCHDCEQYRILQDANAELSILEKTRCQLCQAYRGKTK